MSILKDRRGDDNTRGIKVAVLILMIAFLYIFCVTFLPMTEDGSEQAKTVVPFLLGTVIGTLMGFYYGNKHEQQKPSPNTPADEVAIEDAKLRAAKVVETAKTEEVKEDEKI